MANKKVSQLTSKPSVLTTDLIPIADPSTGQLFKTTLSALGAVIGSAVASVNGLVGVVVLDTDDIQELASPTNRWFTDTRARAALSASSPLTYNSGTGVFSIPAATTSANGYLTSTDWNTFNNKLSVSGTTNYIPKFSSSNTLANSIIYEISGVTYISGYLSIDPFGPVSPLGIIQVGAKTTLNSSDAKILVNNLYTNSTVVNGHGFADNSELTRTSGVWAYCSYDSRAQITGTGINADHYVSFQASPTYNFTGTMLDNFGTYSSLGISSGTITNNYGAYISNPVKTSTGVITNNYGIYIENQTAGSTDYSIYSAGGLNYLAGELRVLSTIYADNVGANFRFKGGNSDASDGGFYANGSGNIFFANWAGDRGFVTLGNGNGYYFGGNFGLGTTTPNSILEIASTTPVFRIQASLSTSFHGIEFRQGAGLDASIKHLPNTAELRISNGRDSTWGGFVTIYTDTTEKVRIASTGAVTCTSSVTATSFFESSDNRLKTLIEDTYQSKGIESVTAKLYTKNGVTELGYYAQDVQAILPSAVTTGENGYLNLSYREVHTAKIARLEKEVEKLKEQLNLI